MTNRKENSVKTSLPVEVSPDELEAKLLDYQKAYAPSAARSSRLDPYKNFIEKLYLDSYSHGQIADFLITIGVTVHSTTVGRFISKKIKGISGKRVQNGNPVPVKPDQSAVVKQLNDLKRPKARSLTYSPYKNESSKED
ncbi:TPA_asm: hypothetical protein G0M49_15035 [Salmonella enterica subsp. enterica serovar Typhimurium]|uniref:Uncharacterized protein n=5 Tax=Salmonella TaxID=590 RepID=A0A709GB21_SALTM|nr:MULTISPECIES: hypothetical protein [Salmonella]AZT74666.1 hypothetical protein ELZ91_23240 [Salmonella enterica subsp. enterica serovar Waycross]EAW2472956.1 hypothetical protein [Salmonella enterica subsp. enterica]EBG5498806.1 hypothetical protein [Salmonella enterica subsp. enterica serovar Lagos]EBH0963038.1 hypothetical protein [Salmonella enterica subsp. enterica serovar Monschaui]ECD4607714.1 hypothetical protein [Salmonella enterica subsp. enterica serovar Oranienburg]ECD9254164.1 